MIKQLFTLGLAFAALAVNAQELHTLKTGTAHQFNTPSSLKLNGNSSVNTVTVDTLFPASLSATCGQSPAYYGWDQVAPYDSGYIFGTGIFPSAGISLTEVAQKYTVTGTGVTVTDVLTLYAVATGSTTTNTAKIYSNNATTHKPNTTALGTSSPLAMSALTTTDFNTYHFATPVAVTAGIFYASVTIPAFGGTDGDSLALLSTSQGCTSYSTPADSLSLMKLSVGWYYTRTLFGGQAGDLDLFIFPVLNITTTGIDKVTKGDLSLFAASPNPTNSNININFSVEKPSTVEIQVYDITGKIVKTVKTTDISAGKNSISVDVTNLEAGSYMYSINASGAKMFSKFIVTK